MGLPLVFTADDLLEYEPYGVRGDYYSSITSETLLALTGAYVSRGALIGQRDGRIDFFDATSTNLGVCFRRWMLDGVRGVRFPPTTSDADLPAPPILPQVWQTSLAGAVSAGDDYRWGFDPWGKLWRWSPSVGSAPVEVTALYNSALSIGDSDGVYPWTYGGDQIAIADFGLGGTRVEDFAVDLVADRCWIRTPLMDGNHVQCFQVSDRSLVGDLFTPNETIKILPTATDAVYVIDEYGWICVYDYNANFVGKMRADVGLPQYGRVWGWDHANKRLLTIGVVADTAPGQSALRVYGYAPRPEPAYLVKPIAKTPPRVGFDSRVTTHVCGAGGEPLAGITVRAAALVALGIPQTDVATDADGDAEFTVDPVSTGGQLLELETIT